MKNSFEAPLSSVVNQYGEQKDKGTLALVTANTTPSDLEEVRKDNKAVTALYINFGQDGSHTDTQSVRNLVRHQSVTLDEIQIQTLSASFMDTENTRQYDTGTLINTLHGIAADYALYNGFQTVQILEGFETASVFHQLPQYYFALNRQIAAVAGEGKIHIQGLTSNAVDVPPTAKPFTESENLVLSMLSGGPDSSVLLSELIRRYYRRSVVEAIFINFGQPYMAQELLSARNIANVCKVRLNEISVAGISQAFVGKGEVGVGYPILRNLINGMYGLASDYARFRNAKELHHANIKEDVINLPWMTEFFAALDQTVGVSAEQDLNVKSEYLAVPKAEVIMRGSEMIGDKLGETFSCLTTSAVGKHCGKCRSCRNRRKAFLASQTEDTTVYEVEPEVGQVEIYEPPLTWT